MDMIIWLVLLAILLGIEALTVGLTTIWFAGGALVGLLAAFLGAGPWLQTGLFLAVSFLLLLFTRPAAVRLLNKKTEKTNVDALVGRTAVVQETIDNLAETGTVKINGLEWTARSKQDGICIPSDAAVKILQVSGVKLIVEKV